jgi:hypothetical protein
MLTDFIEKALAQIDDLAELKVTLVALRLLEAKQSQTASVTEREVLAHSVVQSLSMPELTMRFALQKALSRGTLIELRFEAQVGEGVRYFANNEASRRIIEAIDATTHTGRGRSETSPYDAVAKEIERLELVEAYALSSKDRALIDEWQAQGYTQAEMLATVREALKAPRPKNTPPRALSAIKAVLVAQPPQAPSDYYRMVIAGDAPPGEEIVAMRELMRRWPNGREFAVARGAVALFGVRAVVDGLKRIAQGRQLDVDALVPLLAEQEEASLFYERSRAETNSVVKEIIRLYEDIIGAPASFIYQDILRIYETDLQDVATWKAVFEYAARQNNRNWDRYIKKILLDPSPNIFLSQPVNGIAQFVFDEYRRRIGRLDKVIANEINELAQTVGDEIRWRAAFDAAAKANAMNWNYLKSVLTLERRNDKVEPVNDAAKWAFKEYRARIGRLDKVVAEGINEMALKAIEPSLWQQAFDESAKAGVLKWVYIQKVVDKLTREAAGGRPTRKRLSQYGAKGRKRRQVDYTDTEREAAEERARKYLAETDDTDRV